MSRLILSLTAICLAWSLSGCCLGPARPALPPLAGNPCLAPLPDGVDVEVRDLAMYLDNVGTAQGFASFRACVATREPFRLKAISLTSAFLSGDLMAVCPNMTTVNGPPTVCGNGQTWNEIQVTTNPLPGQPPHVVMLAGAALLYPSFTGPLAPATVVKLSMDACADRDCQTVRSYSRTLPLAVRLVP